MEKINLQTFVSSCVVLAMYFVCMMLGGLTPDVAAVITTTFVFFVGVAFVFFVFFFAPDDFVDVCAICTAAVAATIVVFAVAYAARTVDFIFIVVAATAVVCATFFIAREKKVTSWKVLLVYFAEVVIDVVLLYVFR